jgi:cytochrome c oxidase subunit IV
MFDNRHWLSLERAKIYPRIMFALFIAATLCWVASHIALAGHAQDPYTILLLFNAANIAVPASKSLFAWYYPPTVYLVILPLALLLYVLTSSQATFAHGHRPILTNHLRATKKRKLLKF